MKKIILIATILNCFVATTYSQQILKESFEDGTVTGVQGKAQLFDGYFTNKIVKNNAVPTSQNFTIEAWIAAQEYAISVAAIADKEKEFNTGYLFGINQYGQLSASLAVNGQWLTVVSTEAVPLLKWTHITMKVEAAKAIILYINAKKVGSLAIQGSINFCDSCNLSIGKTQTKANPSNTERTTSANIKTYNYFDGLIDELSIHPTALTDEEIAKNFADVKLAILQPLQYRQMPSGVAGAAKKFGAYYIKLSYASGWDALWRGSEYPDVVVRFENTPIRYVFWRGTGYIPAIVNEKNMWASDQSLEHYGTGECYEAMGDKQTRYSHVRILENTPARVVVHWRYALAGIRHQLLSEDENSWSDWTDEYWTIYPDGIAARKQVLWSNRYEKDKGVMQWQETIFFCQPGTKPQDNVDMDALSFMDMEGNKKTYSWQTGPPKKFETPIYKPIEMVNFKAGYKPYNIFDAKRTCKPFSFGNMKNYTTIPNWNHWPVQQVASDGRNVVAPDKPSHSSLTDCNGNTQIVEKKSDGEYWACMLKGMTNKPIDSLLSLAKSWNNAPALVPISSGIVSLYDKYQRCYILKNDNAETKEIIFKVNASINETIYNLPLVVENWNVNTLKIFVNGKQVIEKKDYSIGTIEGLQQNKIVVFITIKSNAVLHVKITTN